MNVYMGMLCMHVHACNAIIHINLITSSRIMYISPTYNYI
jgi:hypothetical protein